MGSPKLTFNALLELKQIMKDTNNLFKSTGLTDTGINMGLFNNALGNAASQYADSLIAKFDSGTMDLRQMSLAHDQLARVTKTLMELYPFRATEFEKMLLDASAQYVKAQGSQGTPQQPVVETAYKP
jgi:hypothetical protein